MIREPLRSTENDRKTEQAFGLLKSKGAARMILRRFLGASTLVAPPREADRLLLRILDALRSTETRRKSDRPSSRIVFNEASVVDLMASLLPSQSSNLAKPFEMEKA